LTKKLLLLLLKSKNNFKNFPEVDQVVSRIGAAEVTDPMSMEERCYCKAKAKIRVVSADSKDELADKIKAAIENRFQIWKLNLHNPSKCVSTNYFGT
jgi:cobalt-zinc-cadmium resistance protein CzcA